VRRLRGTRINLFFTAGQPNPSRALSFAKAFAISLGAAAVERSPRTTVISLGSFEPLRCEAIARDATAKAREHELDCAFLPEDAAWSRFALLASDMDSTLITIECIDEIADFCGKRPEVAAITEAAMRGEIRDFSESLRRRVALLKGVPETALGKVYDERLKLSPGAESLIEAAREAGLKTLLVSGGFTFFTDRIKARLSLDFALSNVLDIDHGHLTGTVAGSVVDGAAKRAALIATCALLNVTPAKAIVIGDGANDLPMLEEAGLSVAYHAKPAVESATDVAIRFGGLAVLQEWL
jgi:phosphoserine phosphatase